MSLASKGKITSTWLALVTVSLASAGTAELAGNRILAVAVVAAIAAAKGAAILWRFMDIGSAPRPIRFYLGSWLCACSIMIATLFAIGGH